MESKDDTSQENSKKAAEVAMAVSEAQAWIDAWRAQCEAVDADEADIAENCSTETMEEVQAAQAWIDAWRARTEKAAAAYEEAVEQDAGNAESDAAIRADDAQAWIEAWRAKGGSAPEEEEVVERSEVTAPESEDSVENDVIEETGGAGGVLAAAGAVALIAFGVVGFAVFSGSDEAPSSVQAVVEAVEDVAVKSGDAVSEMAGDIIENAALPEIALPEISLPEIALPEATAPAVESTSPASGSSVAENPEDVVNRMLAELQK